MILDDYSEYDGLGLAELVASKAVQPIELVDAAIARIERHNPALNAVVWTMFDRAREMARAPLPQGRFAGVPFLLKDSLGDLEGVPTRHGSPSCQRLRKPVIARSPIAISLPGCCRWARQTCPNSR